MSKEPPPKPQEEWKQTHTSLLKRLLRDGTISATDTQRKTLIEIAQVHFPTTFVANNKASIDNRVKLLRNKINEYKVGVASDGARKRQGTLLL